MSEFKDRIRHFYCQTDNTIKFPDSCEGDLLKIGLSEITKLEAQLEKASIKERELRLLHKNEKRLYAELKQRNQELEAQLADTKLIQEMSREWERKYFEAKAKLRNIYTKNIGSEGYERHCMILKDIAGEALNGE